MILNELAQWGAILFLATIGLGLTRQLGQFLISRKDELTYQGPEVGKSLPDTLLAEPERDALSAAIETSSPHRFGVVAVLSDRCLGCIGLVSQIESDGPPLGLPTLAFLDTSDVHPDFIQRVRAAFTIVCDDSRHARTQKAGITATPYVMLVDSQMRVQKRGISGDLHGLVDEWLRPTIGDRDDPSDESPPYDVNVSRLATTTRNGRPDE